MNTRLTFVHALSPLHAGTGQGVGVIDLPIAREKATGLPFLPGSSLKGSLRSLASPNDVAAVFGPNSSDNDNRASAAQFSDQRLLLLPIRSLAGTFAWVTSPYVLQRFVRDMKEVLSTAPNNPIPKDHLSILKENHCAVVKSTSKITINTKEVYLEDLDLPIQTELDMTDWAQWIGKEVFPNDTVWQTMLTERFCLVPDDIFNFLIATATEITARIKLVEGSKTVQDGGLWYEEALPAESILAGILVVNPSYTNLTSARVFEIIQGLTGKTVQFGGKATVGHGICRVLIGKEGK